MKHEILKKLKPTELYILEAMSESEFETIEAIAVKTGYSSLWVSQALRKLEKLGLVERKKSGRKFLYKIKQETTNE